VRDLLAVARFPSPLIKPDVRIARIPVWSRDGRQLLFLALDGHVMAAAYTTKGDSFAAGKPRVWTETRVRANLFGRSYNITPDGKRLAAIMVGAEDDKLPTHLTFCCTSSTNCGVKRRWGNDGSIRPTLQWSIVRCAYRCRDARLSE